ncbi:MAG: hypothetical protein AAF415_14420 [Pseudomonadota bacterium]
MAGTVESVEWADVQALVRNGFGQYPHSAHLLLRIEDAAAARAWLRDNLERVANFEQAKTWLADRTEGKDLPPNPISVSFTADGLTAIGLAESALHSFPDQFTEGMAPEPGDGQQTTRRAGILGDLGPNNAAHWLWGGTRTDSARCAPQDQIHILLAIYGADCAVVGREIQRHLDAQHGIALAIPLDDHGESPAMLRTFLKIDKGLPVEHFGYCDGISQPLIEGTPHADNAPRETRDFHQVKAGEFVLGYTNERKLKPPTPTASTETDSLNVLPRAQGPGRADLGRNGSFLVARQLEQNVAAFNRLVSQIEEAGAKARVLDPKPDDPRADRHCMREQAAALIMGRSRNGVPLAPEIADGKFRARKFRGEPEDETEEERQARLRANDLANAFGFADLDSVGLHCPMGAHIRRANPRDALAPNPFKALELSKRHRILRRGRIYGPWQSNAGFDVEATGGRGLLFICLNTDLVRQFEFVQHSWINNPHFPGRSGERDPVLGAWDEGASVTLPTRPRSSQIPLAEPLITVRGGAYFFLPGKRALTYLAHLQD